MPTARTLTIDYYLSRFQAGALPGTTFTKAAHVPSHLYDVSGPKSLYRLAIGCYFRGRLVGGLDTPTPAGRDRRKWAYLQAFGFDVVEVPFLDPDGFDPGYPDVYVLASTAYPGGPILRQFKHPFFTHQGYHQILDGYPPLETVAAWEKRTPAAILSAFDEKIQDALIAASNDYDRAHRSP